jgi:hypothetical protein
VSLFEPAASSHFFFSTPSCIAKLHMAGNVIDGPGCIALSATLVHLCRLQKLRLDSEFFTIKK